MDRRRLRACEVNSPKLTGAEVARSCCSRWHQLLFRAPTPCACTCYVETGLLLGGGVSHHTRQRARCLHSSTSPVSDNGDEVSQTAREATPAVTVNQVSPLKPSRALHLHRDAVRRLVEER